MTDLLFGDISKSMKAAFLVNSLGHAVRKKRSFSRPRPGYPSPSASSVSGPIPEPSSASETIRPEERVPEQQEGKETVKVCFRAGRVAECLPYWLSITSDEYILTTVTGFMPALFSQVVSQPTEKCNNVRKSDMARIDLEVNDMLRWGVIRECEASEDQWVSPVFSVDKPGSDRCRLMLNLKAFNPAIYSL